MRLSSGVLPWLFVASAGCPPPGSTVDSDTFVDTNPRVVTPCTGFTSTGSGDPFLESIFFDCSGETECIWSVTAAGGEIGGVQLCLAQTGDTSGWCVDFENCSEDAFWTEYHDAFQPGSGSAGSGTWSISLGKVSDPADQFENTTTFLDTKDPATASEITYGAWLTDSTGNPASCFAGGENTAYYADRCNEI